VADVERLVRLDELRPLPARDGGEMRLELAPDGLGRIEVRVTVKADAVHASVYAQHDHAREALEANRQSLETALNRSNLRLEGFSVGLGHQPRGEQRDLRDDPTPAPARRPLAVAAAALPAAELRPTHPGGLSLHA
jgi:hypothetical protein